MNKSRLLGAVCALTLSTLVSLPSTVQAITLDDGSTHNIDYTVTDGVVIGSSTTVNLETGADISGIAPDFR